MNLLILGGGVFLGAAALQSARARGHHVTVLNRGHSRSAWPADVEVLIGDRGNDLSPLANRRWDAVIDTCGYTPADVQRSAEALRDSSRYLFVSSISAYATTQQAPIRETDPLAASEGIARDDRSPAHYGAQKAACEAEVLRAFGERALIVRPGLIAGPGDPTGRFSHWPWRMLDGGAMLVPDVPTDAPLQFIDVRDLGDWLIALIERQASGAFNATGPVNAACDWSTLVSACAEEASACGVTPAHAVRVSEAFLSERGVRPWGELPLWLPSADKDYRGFMRVSVERAVANGLRTRPLRETAAAVMNEGVPPPDDPRRAGRLTREREAELLAAWADTDPINRTTGAAP